MKVIDVSDYQTNIDWSKVIDEGVQGVIVKVSEGRTLMELFAKHIASAAARGLKWGVYCLTRAPSEERAIQEADVLIDALEALGYGIPDMGIWYDVEPDEAETHDPEELTALCSAFISECNRRGYSAGIYGNYTTLNRINTGDLADYVPYWAAQYSYSNDFKEEHPELRVIAWQWSDQYEIDGQPFDMNDWED